MKLTCPDIDARHFIDAGVAHPYYPPNSSFGFDLRTAYSRLLPGAWKGLSETGCNAQAWFQRFAGRYGVLVGFSTEQEVTIYHDAEYITLQDHRSYVEAMRLRYTETSDTYRQQVLGANVPSPHFLIETNVKED